MVETNKLFRYVNEPSLFSGEPPEQDRDAKFVVDYEQKGSPSPETFAKLVQAQSKVSGVLLDMAGDDEVRVQAEDVKDSIDTTMEVMIDRRETSFNEEQRTALSDGDLSILPEVERDNSH